MKTYTFRRFGASALVATALTGAAYAAPAKKAPVKPKLKPAIGIKHQPQLTGSVGRFGDLFELNSGWTYQVLSARYSYDAFDNYNQTYPGPDQKLLILRVAIKNANTKDDWTGDATPAFQAQDTNNQLYDSDGNYRSTVTANKEFSMTLKPGQGVGQEASNKLEVAIPVPDNAQITKIVLQAGRKGSKENVMRFFVAGTQGGDPKNVIAPLPVANTTTPIKAEGFFPSKYFAFRVNGVTFTPGPIAKSDPAENRRFAVVNLTVKNTTSKPESTYEFIGGEERLCFTDADGEKYPVSGDIGLLKASTDEQTTSDFDPGVERTLRLVFEVPATGDLKTLQLASTGGKLWIFDASAWK